MEKQADSANNPASGTGTSPASPAPAGGNAAPQAGSGISNPAANAAANPAASADIRNEMARFILEQLKGGQLAREQALRFLNELKPPKPAAAAPAAEPAARPVVDDIAIIGMACRFPQADTKEDFWHNLLAGRNSIRPFPLSRQLDLAAIDTEGTKLFQGGFLENVDGFDNEYFRIPPVMAKAIDPYQRLLMEVLVETIEDAGYHRGNVYGKNIGVFAGNDHTHRLFNNYLNFIDQPDFNAITGSWTAVLASRLSYLFNLKGPAVVLDTACSSGLVALDYAIKALRNGDCESALIGAANLFFAPGKGIVGEIENEDFLVRAFDKRASGTVWGEGVAAIMIKPLSHALRDGDPIHAVVKAIAVNNDGASNGLTAPNAKAQQEILLKTWERAQINPENISYIETHGTGTHLGDPIEIKGLIGAFERNSRRKQFCGIGSVKTNIGHTVGVAGLASLIKVVLSLKHQQLPPSINFSEPNPFIDFCNSPVFLNDRILPWPKGAQVRTAGISSFSLSGTNCHVLVQEASGVATSGAGASGADASGAGASDVTPSACGTGTAAGAPATVEPAAVARLFPLSARNPALLLETVRRLVAHFSGVDTINSASQWQQACYTASVAREHHPLRAVLLLSEPARLRPQLERLLAVLEQDAETNSVAGQATANAQSGGQVNGQTSPQSASTSALREWQDGDDYLLLQTVPGPESEHGGRQSREAAIDGARSGAPASLLALARLYVKGAPVKWELLYRDQTIARLHLPAQPFEHKRFWDKAPGTLAAKTDTASAAASHGNSASHAANLPTSQGEGAPAAGAGASASPPELNRAAVLARVQDEASRVAGLEEGLSPLPYQVAAYIWTEVLGYQQVNLHEDFYALGGDSLSALKIVQLFNLLFGLNLQVTDLLGAPNLHEFVQKLEQQYGFAAILLAPADDTPHTETTGHTVGGENAKSGHEPILPLPEAGAWPLSRAQKRMFLLERLSPGSTVYNVNGVVPMPGLPDLAATGRIIDRIIARHEVLRTAFTMEGEQLQQQVWPAVDFPPFTPELIQLEANGDAALQAALARFIRPFDIARPPLLRLGFFVAPGQSCHMAIDMHHIVTDGSSMGVLVGEFMALHAGHNLPALPFQYKDFAVWQNARFDRATVDAEGAEGATGGDIGSRAEAGPAAGKFNPMQAHREFWLAEFADPAPALELQTDYPRPAYQDFKGAKQHWLIDATQTAQLQQLARQQGTTLFILMLASLNALLYRLGGGADLVLGTPVAGRSRHDLHGLIGMFVNTLALRNRIREEDSFSDLLARVKQHTLAALNHQDYPYEELVEALQLPRNGGRNPLFDIYFVFQNEDMGLASGGQGLSMVAFDNGTAKFDMTIVARQDASGIHIDWEYATALYHADSIARMGRAWQKLLADICHAPHQRVDALDLLTQSERTQLLQGFNQTASEFPRDKTLAQLFEAQAAQHADAIALEMDGQELSYAELNQRANRLAHHLLAQGVTPGQCVGLLYQRSFGMIEAILAVLKTGAIYVPLDAEHPPERCIAMLDECEARCLLAGPDMTLDELTIPLIHPHLLKLGQADSSNPHTDPAKVNGDSLAYIIFTSGSTGRPKGTLIRHKSAARVVLNTNYLTLSPSDRILQLSNYAFDGSVFDIWAALLHGGRLVLVHKRDLIDMDALSRLISERQISVFFITTALFNALVDTRIECLQQVRHILFGGELASIKHVQRVAALLGPGRLIHVYGPTETTVFATAHPLDAAKLTHGNVPIGAPLANTTAFVLDSKLQPVPIGVAGELYIGGDGVSLGYLGRPDLTNERFLPNPFEPGQTMYHSGDVVKWQLDGDQPAIVFLGRRDHQVKIRGFRIELGEIEAALGRHAAVKESLVSADPDANGNKQLCAWVVPQVWDEASAPALAQELRGFLASNLPDYMVPAALMCLQAFELNRNGKIDRAKLPAALPQQQEPVAARDELEALLAQIWAELLGLPGVGIHDNFFALGGDSIKGIQIVARLQAHGYAAQIPLLFQHQTIAELAPHVQRAGASTAEQGAVTGEVGLNPIQHWMLDEDGLWHGHVPRNALPGSALPRNASDPRHHFNQAMLIARSNLASAEQMAQALAALCEQHDALRSVFRRGAADAGIDPNVNGQTGNGWQASIRAPGCQPWQILEFDLPPLATNNPDLAAVAADPAMQAALLQCQTGLDIEAGTLISAGLFRAAPDSGQMSYLCLTVHHLVVDVVSWNILLEDLQTCLRQTGEGQPLQLPAKTASVPAWQRALQDYAGDAHGARASLPYWLALTPHAADTLPGQPATASASATASGNPASGNPASAIAAAGHAPALSGTLAQSRIDSVLLPASVSQQLLGEANRSYTTEPQHLLLTALGNALGQWCSSDTTLVLLESHGREGVEALPDIGRTVGWFTTTYPFALQRGKDAAHAIKHTKEALRNVPGKGRDFGALRYLAIDPAQRTRLARLVPAVSFNFLGSGQGASHVCPLGRQLVNSPHTPLPQALDLIASFKGEQLELEALYDSTRLNTAAVRDFLGLFMQELTALVAHCCGVQGEEKTASDFTVTKIDQSELDDIFSDLDLL